MDNEIRAWRLTCIPRRFEWLKTDDGFATLVALGRCVNQLRFAMYSFSPDKASESPSYLGREMVGAVFSISAALHEGIVLSQKHVQKYYSRYPEFDALRAIWKRKENAVFLKDVKRLRDQTAAHFDPDAVRVALKALSFADECVFVEGHGDRARDVHCKLADGVALITVTGEFGSYEDLVTSTEKFYKNVAGVAGAFADAADILLARILTDYGFTLAYADRGEAEG